jgi:ferredoxin
MSQVLEVLSRACIRCAACASVAPGLFAVDRGPARVLRAPETEPERRAARAAAILCPTGAVRALDERAGGAREP